MNPAKRHAPARLSAVFRSPKRPSQLAAYCRKASQPSSAKNRKTHFCLKIGRCDKASLNSTVREEPAKIGQARVWRKHRMSLSREDRLARVYNVVETARVGSV